MAYILEHSGAQLLVATREFADAAAALARDAGLELVVEGEQYDEWLAGDGDPGATAARRRRARRCSRSTTRAARPGGPRA